MYNLKTIAEATLRQNLKLQQNERYLVFTDANSRWEEREEELVKKRLFLHEFFEAFRALGEQLPGQKSDKYESTKKHGAEPGENIWFLAFGEKVYRELVKRDLVWKLKGGHELQEGEWRTVETVVAKGAEGVVDCIVAFPWYSVTHTRFRRLANLAGARFASMPMLTESVVEGPMSADWEEVAASTKRVHRILAASEKLILTSKAGSHLEMRVAGAESVHMDTGDLGEPGCVGNLPAGEAYLVPQAESSTGRLVFTAAPDLGVIAPTTVTVEQGQVVGVESDTPYAEILRRKFERDFHVRNIAELGVGTNPEARNVGSMIEGEKIRGTVHIALGDDSGIGGSNEATEHLDHVLTDCELRALLPGGEEVTIVSARSLLI